MADEGRGCEERVFECSGGPVLVVACPPPLDPLSHPRARRERFRWVSPGSLSVEYEDDWSRGYFAYIIPGRGGGFYMEAPLDSLDDPSCGSTVAPWILERLSGWGLDPRALEMLGFILSRKVFRGA